MSENRRDKSMSDIRPFSIHVADEDLQDLRERLARTRWPNRETPEDWTQGVPLDYVKEIAEYWLTDYNWRTCEDKLNQWSGYLTEINGLDVHFLHIESPEAHARPLIMTHGWPGSIIEFLKVIGPLVDPASHGGEAADAFHLVLPSLPGYGFSGKPEATGWTTSRTADAWNELMQRLGYRQYFAQGGDWGSIVTHDIALQHSDTCLGIHVNMPLARPNPGSPEAENLTEFEQGALESMRYYQDWDSGYSKQQSTRPQTLGYGLADSPVGQLAWILEKFWAWTDCDGHPENALTRDEMLDNIMLYWLTNAGASSARLYWESFRTRSADPIQIPVGCSVFPHEIFRCSERWARVRYPKLIHYNALDKGGHFAAFEQPESFVDEVRGCFRQLR